MSPTSVLAFLATACSSVSPLRTRPPITHHWPFSGSPPPLRPPVLFPFVKLLEERPRQHEEVIRLGPPGFLLGNDRNPGANGVLAPFLRAPFGRRRNQRVIEPVILQNDV